MAERETVKIPYSHDLSYCSLIVVVLFGRGYLCVFQKMPEAHHHVKWWAYQDNCDHNERTKLFHSIQMLFVESEG